jgi:hypothetical protein
MGSGLEQFLELVRAKYNLVLLEHRQVYNAEFIGQTISSLESP